MAARDAETGRQVRPGLALEWIGRHARLILLAGLALVPFLPSSGGALAPVLPWLVVLLIGLAVARIDLGAAIQDFGRPAAILPIIAALILFQPVLSVAVQGAGWLLGLTAPILLVLLVFTSAPPLSSAPNLALMLRYDGRLALSLTLIGTVLSPLLVPASFWLVSAGGIDPVRIAGRVAMMLAGGLVLGLALRGTVGPGRIAARAKAFDGLAALIMLAFLVPLLDGVRDHVTQNPRLALQLAALALMLNIGGNLAMRMLLRKRLRRETADSAGLVFGNRNISVILAALPPDPSVSLYVAVAQVPIYATPFILSLIDRPARPCRPSSEF